MSDGLYPNLEEDQGLRSGALPNQSFSFERNGSPIDNAASPAVEGAAFSSSCALVELAVHPTLLVIRDRTQCQDLPCGLGENLGVDDLAAACPKGFSASVSDDLGSLPESCAHTCSPHKIRN